MNRCNIIDYITDARIEKAKTLMEQSELTNARLAQLVGYTNDVVFIRAFKKLEGDPWQISGERKRAVTLKRGEEWPISHGSDPGTFKIRRGNDMDAAKDRSRHRIRAG